MVTTPTRKFIAVVDPDCLQDLVAQPLRYALFLVRDLMDLDPPLTIRLVLPVYLATSDQQEFAANLIKGWNLPLILLPEKATVPALTLSHELPRRMRERIERGAEGECRGLRLLALTSHLKADGLVTALPSLVEARYQLSRHHRLRIIPPSEFPDFVEICARGHDIPCGVTNWRLWFPPGLVYTMSHWKCKRLWEWFNKVMPSLSDDDPVKERLRSALLNRYPFILHARDRVRFYQLQSDYILRHDGRSQEFRGALNYHLTGFYVHVWGMLDALAGIANLRLGLGLRPFRCGIDPDDFFDALRGKAPAHSC